MPANFQHTLPLHDRLLLAAYYGGSYPLRIWRNLQRARACHAPVMVLFYHRVADNHPNPWTISTRMFERQVRWLRSRFDLVSLAEAQRRLRSGQNDRACVSITFDDGYADNCAHALPLLLERRIPCTYFVTTGHILGKQPFAHDVARGEPLAPNTPEEIRELAAAGVEIGAHTRTHADLGSLDDDRRLGDEIIGSKLDLEQLIGKPVRYFAFPYGQHANMSRRAMRMALDSGYEAVCSAYGGFNFPGDDPLHLQRIHADTDMLRFRNWLTVDERKLRIARFSYRDEPVCITLGAAT